MMKNRLLMCAALVPALAVLGGAGFALGAGAVPIVSQKGRAFTPGTVEIAVGDALTIRNDDEFVHDIFVDSNGFKFDSGEQKVGQNVQIVFPRAGTYQVRCAIHPKMRLDVEVK